MKTRLLRLMIAPALLACGHSGTASVTIQPSGGSVSVAGVKLDFPAGAVDKPTALTVQVSASSVGDGPEIDVEPDVPFAQPVVVTLSPQAFDASNGAQILRLQENGDWDADDEIDPGAGSSRFITWAASGAQFSIAGGGRIAVRHPTAASDPCGSYSSWEASARYERRVTGIADPKKDPAGCVVNVQTRYPGQFHYADAVDQPACATGKSQPPCAARDPNEKFMMAPEVADKLAIARYILVNEHPGLDLNINGAYDSSRRRHSGPGSFHYRGVALDLAVCRVVNDAQCDKVVDDYAFLPAILLRAGFTWALFEGDAKPKPPPAKSTGAPHIHASAPSTACGVPPPATTANTAPPPNCGPPYPVTGGGTGGTGGGSDAGTPVAYGISISIGGLGSGTVSANPPGSPALNYPAATPPTRVQLTAQPAAGSTFTGWGGDCSSAGTSPVCAVLMSSNHLVSASFDAGGTSGCGTTNTGLCIANGGSCGARCANANACTGNASTCCSFSGSGFCTDLGVAACIQCTCDADCQTGAVCCR